MRAGGPASEKKPPREETAGRKGAVGERRPPMGIGRSVEPRRVVLAACFRAGRERRSRLGLADRRRMALRASTAKFSGEQRPELQDPSSHRFAGDIQTALSEQIFDVAIAERKTHIEPNA